MILTQGHFSSYNSLMSSQLLNILVMMFWIAIFMHLPIVCVMPLKYLETGNITVQPYINGHFLSKFLLPLLCRNIYNEYAYTELYNAHPY